MVPEIRPLAGRWVRPIGLGCMSLATAYGRTPSDAEALAVLDRALALGVDHLDTARAYGGGRAEALIGRALRGRREGVLLASKGGLSYDREGRRVVDGRPEALRAAVEASLRALATDHIDLYYLHRVDERVPVEESVGALARLVEAGAIGAIGLSEVSAATLRRASAVHPIAAVQNEYSPWTRNPEIALLAACRELGTALVAFAPLGRGALAAGLPEPARLDDFRGRIPRFQPPHRERNAELLARFAALAAEAGLTPAQLALRWVLSRDERVHAIPGTASAAHLEENLAALECSVTAEILAEVDALLAPEQVAGARYGPEQRANVDTEEFPVP
ncbi:MAG: aldo/keto reductase [Porticoccaceae bacterium]|nr:MAG: aldo/keto reductase [Porticoccaceae bacterium]